MLSWLWLALLAVLRVDAFSWDDVTPLDEYVHSDDGEFKYSVMNEADRGDHVIYTLEMVSQRWFDEALTTQPLWTHHLMIFVPKNPDPRFTDAGFLFVGGLSNDDDPPSPTNGRMTRLAHFAVDVGVPVGYLLQNPNQPIYFQHDPSARVEDFIIAHTWKLIIEDESGDPDRTLNLLFPMTKAGKRALDTMEEFVPSVSDTSRPEKFMVTGYSKRGWVTWLLGCTDRRVFAIAPTVFDLLGFKENLHHHNRAMGGWSWAFAPYWLEDTSRYLNHPMTEVLGKDIDPIEYNERLTMPKMIIVGGNDQFFPPDGSHFFFDELNEPKFMCLWENDDHGLGAHQDEIDRNLEAFFVASHEGFDWPKINYNMVEGERHASIVLTGDEPLDVKGWVADTTEHVCEPLRNFTCRRDFRFDAFLVQTEIEYELTPVDHQGSNYRLDFDAPEIEGRYRGFFMEMTYPGPDGRSFRFSTEINIVPDTFPYPRCETEAECTGILV